MGVKNRTFAFPKKNDAGIDLDNRIIYYVFQF